MNILAIEDNLINMALLRAILTRQGHRLLEAATLAQSRLLLKDQRIDLVLLDLALPDGSGLELLREIRDGQLGPAMPVIVVSASVLAEEQSKARACGCAGFVRKPLVSVQLLAAIETACGRKNTLEPSRTVGGPDSI